MSVIMNYGRIEMETKEHLCNKMKKHFAIRYDIYLKQWNIHNAVEFNGIQNIKYCPFCGKKLNING